MTPQIHHSIPAMLPPANCFTVFVIDDLTANRVLLGKVLKGAGYGVMEASDGRAALEMLRDLGIAPDLIVTDIEMPELDGIALVGEIRRLENAISRVPIIAASGNADEGMRREALAAGCDLFLTKPFDLAQLRREIAALIKRSRQTSASRDRLDEAATPAANRLQVRVHEAG